MFNRDTCTHSRDVVFENVGLVITDEQHRFGVNQRQMLREKGAMTNVLFMTATPIPRTLAISVFGEMDVFQLPKKVESLSSQVGLNMNSMSKS